MQLLANESQSSNTRLVDDIKPGLRRKAPGIVSLYSYKELVELAFSPDTPSRQASKAKTALIRARGKGGNINRFEFLVPFFPETGSIVIRERSGQVRR